MTHRTFETTNAFGIVRVVVTDESAIIHFIPNDRRASPIELEVPFTQERLQEIESNFDANDLDEMMEMARHRHFHS